MMGDLFGGSDGSDEEAWDDCEQFDLPGACFLACIPFAQRSIHLYM
jgi:hypothetical protein